MWLYPCGFRGSSLRHGTAPRDRCGKHTGNYSIRRRARAVRLLSWMLLLVDAGAPFVQRRPASIPSIVPLPV